MGVVIGVVGGSGGVGASSFAAVLAAVAEPAVLVDLDVTGGGIDVVLGIDAVPGARWSGLRVAGGHLDPEALFAGLPQWGDCVVLAADVATIEPAAVAQVLAAATSALPAPTVVLDLPRHSCAERAAALLRCELVVVLARSDVPGVVAAHGLVAGLPELPVGLVARRGAVAAHEAAALIGVPLLGSLPGLGSPARELDPRRLPRGASRVANGILDGARVPAHYAAAAG